MKITKMAGSQSFMPSARQRTKMSVEKLCWVYRDVLTTVRGSSLERELRVVAAMEALAWK